MSAIERYFIILYAATPPHNLYEHKCSNITLASLNTSSPDDGRRPKHVGVMFM
jgi:hypothetical protein